MQRNASLYNTRDEIAQRRATPDRFAARKSVIEREVGHRLLHCVRLCVHHTLYDFEALLHIVTQGHTHYERITLGKTNYTAQVSQCESSKRSHPHHPVITLSHTWLHLFIAGDRHQVKYNEREAEKDVSLMPEEKSVHREMQGGLSEIGVSAWHSGQSSPPISASTVITIMSIPNRI